jgi:[ribosomal protein S18]-alanine N-acetyltransferase
MTVRRGRAGEVPAEWAMYESWVAEMDGAVRGWAAVRSLGAGEAELLQVEVEEGYRRRGIASALLAAALEGTVFLEVRAGNAGAIALYSTLGFAVVGRRRGYYADPVEDALVMEKRKV